MRKENHDLKFLVRYPQHIIIYHQTRVNIHFYHNQTLITQT
jgi:hypothetical protein